MESAANNGFPDTSMFTDSEQFNAYENLDLFSNTADSNFNDTGWAVNAADFPGQSRGPQRPASNWQQQSGAHLSAPSSHADYSNQNSPYARPANRSSLPYGQNSFNNFGTSPEFQYRQQHYDPSALASQPANGQAFNVAVHEYNSPAPNTTTITLQALNRDAPPQTRPGAPFRGSGYQSTHAHSGTSGPTSAAAPSARAVDIKALIASVPIATNSGMFSIIDFDKLAQATSSERMGNFVNVAKEPCEFDCTRSAIPMYTSRKSRSELRAMAGSNPIALAKIGKKLSKVKSFSSASATKPLLTSNVSSPQRIKHEQVSSSAESSSDDDEDSSYTDDDEADSPLPAKRPENPKGGIEYDTIKALWRSKRKALDGDSIRKSLVGFWELVKTIRDRWKADAAALAEAEEKERTGELPLLRSRVKDQRDMVEAAFRTALKHGHRGIVELLSENVSLVFLCYQFLLDRLKVDDCNGGLSRAILETMSLFTTLSKDKLEKTHLVKVLPRYQKKGDAKTQYWVKKINTNAESASKESKSDQKETTKTDASGAEAKLGSAAVPKSVPEAVAGVKRAAATSANETASKRLATSNARGNVSFTINGAVKKAASNADASKPSAANVTPVTARKTIAATSKPTGFFSSLQSASKKPGTTIAEKPTIANPKLNGNKTSNAGASGAPKFSFAETMANLAKPKDEAPKPRPQKETPLETPEARAKRLRKEQRRKLQVQFKTGEDLVSIRYFTHDPAEEVDHNSSQMRDVSDVGGEGRMFKQQSHLMDMDDEDEAAEEAENLRDHKPSSAIDFSVISADDRGRNYAPFGGGQNQPDSAERSAREDYESHNLIVFYTDPSTIPPNPKEPADPYHGEQGVPLTYFGAPEQAAVYTSRAREKRQRNTPLAMPPPGPMGPDISSILASLTQGQAPQPVYQQPTSTPSLMGQPQMGASYPTPAQTTPGLPPNFDLASLLATLNNNNSNNHQQQQQQSAQAGIAPMGFSTQVDGDASMNNAKHPNYKTKVCKFWQDGRCQKGDACSYLH